MKKALVMFVVVGLVAGMAVPILAQQGSEDSTKFIQVLASELKALLDADSVLGTPIEFEGAKIVPVVSRGFGFGGASGIGGDEQGQGGSGTGAGAGGGVMPLSFLVITKDGEVSLISAKKGELGEIIKAAAPMLLEVIKTGQTQQQEEAPAEEEAEQPEQQP